MRSTSLPSILIAAALVLVASTAMAHRVGLSRGTYLAETGRLTSTLTFSSEEVGADGGVSARDIVSRLRVVAGGERCAGVLESAHPVARDGISLKIVHECDRTQSPVNVDLGFLGNLADGHRHLAKLVTSDGSTEVVADRDNAHLAIAGGGDSVEQPTRTGFWEFVRFGFTHILSGADHLLFLLGIVLARESVRDLVFAVTAFTVAHSLSLALSVLGIVHVNPAWVEPLIALSVAYLGVEVLRRRSSPHHWRLTFAFGLVHGLGFAGALEEIELSRTNVGIALGGFNIGVELGQLAIVAVAVPLIAVARRLRGFSLRVVPVAAVGLTAAGVVWCVERVASAFESSTTAEAKREDDASKTDPIRAASQSDMPAAMSGTSAAIRSIYPNESPATDPLVERVCRAFNETPRIRRAACEGRKPGIVLVSECTRMLGSSVSSGAISMNGDVSADCLKAWDRRYEGCGWIDARSLETLDECRDVLRGTLEEGERCRSSLECRGSLHCDGVGPMDTGYCRPPKAPGAACGHGVDPLASYVPLSTGQSHPECAGICANQRCRSQS